MSTSRYIPRPLARYLWQCPQKVAILEGPRAVGKTSMVRHDLAENHDPQYFYHSLSNEETYRRAKDNVDQWVENLRLPCVIDEAQRIPQLQMAVKNQVDTENAGQGPLFVLTGSAALSRTQLSGQDPLARRSLRYRLYPFTRRELNRNTTESIVDQLWSATPNMSYHGETDRAQLGRFMEQGGFPIYALNFQRFDPASYRLSIQSDIDGVLGDTILPCERLDRSIASHVLRELLVEPSQILNVKKVSDQIGSQPLTIERYISIFLRRYLIGYLPNLRSAPAKQSFARSKIRPIDTSLSVEAFMRSGDDFMKDPVIFGEIFESFVSNQIIPEIEWSKTHPDAFYWREPYAPRPHEVDLVLEHDGELIGIEVKSASQAKSEDFSGLYALKKWSIGRILLLMELLASDI